MPILRKLLLLAKRTERDISKVLTNLDSLANHKNTRENYNQVPAEWADKKITRETASDVQDSPYHHKVDLSKPEEHVFIPHHKFEMENGNPTEEEHAQHVASYLAKRKHFPAVVAYQKANGNYGMINGHHRHLLTQKHWGKQTLPTTVVKLKPKSQWYAKQVTAKGTK